MTFDRTPCNKFWSFKVCRLPTWQGDQKAKKKLLSQFLTVTSIFASYVNITKTNTTKRWKKAPMSRRLKFQHAHWSNIFRVMFVFHHESCLYMSIWMTFEQRHNELSSTRWDASHHRFRTSDCQTLSVGLTVNGSAVNRARQCFGNCKALGPVRCTVGMQSMQSSKVGGHLLRDTL